MDRVNEDKLIRARQKLDDLYWMIDGLFVVGTEDMKELSGLTAKQLVGIGLNLESLIESILEDLGVKEVM